MLDGKKLDVLILENKISKIEENIDYDAKVTLDGTNKAIIPSFANTHSHAAMSILKGYADDMALQEWLETKIWPAESKLTEEHIYYATKFACLEMIKSGTTFFNDMYFNLDASSKAIKKMGIRSNLGYGIIDIGN